MSVAEDETSRFLAVADFLASWTSSACALSFNHPVDTLRIRLQTVGQKPWNTIRKDGILSLYAGITMPLIGNLPVSAMIYTLNEYFKRKFHEMSSASSRLNNGSGDDGRSNIMSSCSSPSPISNNSVGSDGRSQERQLPQHSTRASTCTSVSEVSPISMKEVLLSAFLAGFTASFFVGPIAIVRTQIQVSARDGRKPLRASQVMTRLYKSEGLRGFYRGFPFEMFCTSCGWMSYLATYEGIKRLILGSPEGAHQHHHQGVSSMQDVRENTPDASTTTTTVIATDSACSDCSEDATHIIHQELDKKGQSHTYVPLHYRIGAAALSAVVSWTSFFPLDMLKNRMQGDTICWPPPSSTTSSSSCCESTGKNATETVVKNGLKSKPKACNTTTTKGTSTRSSSNVSVKKAAESVVLQRQYRSSVDCFRQTIRKNGWNIREYYVGFPMVLARSSLSSSFTLPLFDFLKPRYRRLAKDFEETLRTDEALYGSPLSTEISPLVPSSPHPHRHHAFDTRELTEHMPVYLHTLLDMHWGVFLEPSSSVSMLGEMEEDERFFGYPQEM